MLFVFVILIPIAIVALIIRMAGGIKSFLPLRCTDATAMTGYDTEQTSSEYDQTYDYTTTCSPSGCE